jgi:mRNA-degrading endonuclease toxin of MazEF toxin-antitoxin module
LGCNIGHEVDGKGPYFARPVLVLKKYTSKTCLVLPLSTADRRGSYFLPIEFKDRVSVVLLNQARVLDSRRFFRRIGKFSNKDFGLVVKNILI